MKGLALYEPFEVFSDPYLTNLVRKRDISKRVYDNTGFSRQNSYEFMPSSDFKQTIEKAKDERYCRGRSPSKERIISPVAMKDLDKCLRDFVFFGYEGL